MNKSFSKECEKWGKPSDNFDSSSASSDLFLCEHEDMYQYSHTTAPSKLHP